MVGKLKVLAAVALGGALLSEAGRARLTALPAQAGRALRRDPSRLPKGVQEFPATFVDKRAAPDGQAPAPVAGGDAGAITAEYYQEHPAG